MAVEGGLKCVKFLLFFFNFIFWLCGLALVVVGVVIQVAMNNTLVMTSVSGSATPIVLIVVGVVIFFVSFFGCCGAWKENHCMVTMFALLLSLIVIVEIGTAIAAYIFRSKVNDVVYESLKDIVDKYNNSDANFRKGVDALQQQLQCCGINSTSDWQNYTSGGRTVPDSCCINVTTGCGVGTMKDPTKVFQTGCTEALEAFLQKNIKWVIVAALVIALLQVIGIVFACMLSRGIRSGYEVM